MRNDFFAHLETLPLSYFQTHRTGDLMSRATNDLNAVRMMIGPSVMYSANTILVFVVALAVMLTIDARLTLLALIPLPFVSISVKYFGSAIHTPVRADSGAAVRHQRRRAGGALGRPRRARVPAGARRARALPRRQRGVSPPQPRPDRAAGVLLSEHVVLSRPRRAAGAVDRQPRGDRRPHHDRPVRRVQRVSDDAELADDRVRLGHQHAAARHGVVEADARGAGSGAGQFG